MNAQIHYRIIPHDPHAHLYRVSLHIQNPLSQGQRVRLPAWIPGSYMIRDFARNIVWLRAWQGNQEVAVKRIDKSTWALGSVVGPVVVDYEVYAWDLSVRAAHLDQHHAYFNGSSVFLAVQGQEHHPCTVDIDPHSGGIGKQWRVATTLREDTAARYGYGRYKADSYDELIDHPVEIADFTLASFDACGVPHEVVITGKHTADMPRLCADLKKICEYQIRMFGEPAPYDRYVFITWAVGDGYGGLEHRSSTSLICCRDDLPSIKQRDRVSEGYRTFLGLCSHEYFHNWNVKRIKPAKFLPYDLTQESYTELLWAFEGITSYYDDLVLLRTGLIDVKTYLEILGQNVTRLLRSPGRLHQSLVDSSFDAWTKFYKQDENSPNAIVSYYLKGSIVALGLDLLLRDLGQHRLSLDSVMLVLWREYAQKGRGVGESGIEDVTLALVESRIGEAAVQTVQAFFHRALRETEDFDLAHLLHRCGVKTHLRASESPSDKGGTEGKSDTSMRAVLGGNLVNDPQGARIQTLLNGSAGHKAGLSAGDVIIAVNGIRTDANLFEKHLSRYCPGDHVSLHAFRRDELFSVEVELSSAPLDTCYFSIEDEEKLKYWLFP